MSWRFILVILMGMSLIFTLFLHRPEPFSNQLLDEITVVNAGGKNERKEAGAAAGASDDGTVYAERNRRVAEICKKYGLIRQSGFNKTVLKRFFIWNGEYNMGYCLQSKTGTTTWMLNWKRISHLPPEVQLPQDNEHGIIKHLFSIPPSLRPNEVDLLLKRSYSFYFVRHPFNRLVSAFHDKIMSTNYAHWEDFRSTILPNETEASIFGRFVEAHLSGKYNIQWDIHNLPLHLKCDVCNIPYQVIGKQETELRDSAYIIRHLGLSGIMDPNLKVHVTSDQKKVAAERIQSTDLELFATLNTETVWRLYQYYKIDFLMYNYDPMPYFRVAKKNATFDDTLAELQEA